MILTSISLWSLIPAVVSAEFYLSQECFGLYGKHDIPGSPKNASVTVSITPKSKQGKLAILIHHFDDRSLLVTNPTFSNVPLLCRTEDIKTGVCDGSQTDTFRLIHLDHAKAPILNQKVQWDTTTTTTPVPDTPSNSSNPNTPSAPTRNTDATDNLKSLEPVKIKFESAITGYYCLYVGSYEVENGIQFSMEVQIQNPYGLLPARFYPTLPFFATFGIIYLVFAIIWVSLSLKYWREILPIQHFVSFVLVFLLIEMFINYGFYANYNTTGKISNLLLVLTAIFNAGRVSLSFFMILIVSLGYGVLRPSLGTTMYKCIAMAVVQFLFATFYAVGSVLVTDTTGLFWVMLLALPLSGTMTAFYMWILTALRDTVVRLKERKQPVKLQMYQKLTIILFFSLIAVFLIFVLNSIFLSFRDKDWFIAIQWKWRWILLEGSLNIVYFITFFCIVLLWRPTKNNQRYGLEQLATEDPGEDGFPMSGMYHGADDEGYYDDDLDGYGPYENDDVEMDVLGAHRGSVSNANTSRTVAGVNNGTTYVYEETADDLLAWVEKHVGLSDTVPQQSTDKYDEGIMTRSHPAEREELFANPDFEANWNADVEFEDASPSSVAKDHMDMTSAFASKLPDLDAPVLFQSSSSRDNLLS